MSDNLLEKYLGKRNENGPSVPLESDGEEDLGSFGWLRGIRDRAIMLEVRHRDGKVSAFGYAWLDSVVFDPSEGITLHFARKSVKIIGQNLNLEVRPNLRLLDGLLRQRIPWVAETAGTLSLPISRERLLIEEIQVS